MAERVEFGYLNAPMFLRRHLLSERGLLVTSVVVVMLWVLYSGQVSAATDIETEQSENVLSESECCGTTCIHNEAKSQRTVKPLGTERGHGFSASGHLAVMPAETISQAETSWWNSQRTTGLLVCFLSTFILSIVLVEAFRRKAWRNHLGLTPRVLGAFGSNGRNGNFECEQEAAHGAAAGAKQVEVLTAEAVASERQRIAMNLHDTVEQTLSAATFHLQAATIAPTEELVQNYIGMAEQAIRLSRQEIRATINQLYLVPYQTMSLQEALEVSCAPLVRGRNMEFRIRSRVALRDLDAVIMQHIVLMVREAVSNSVKHSGGSWVAITIDCTDTRLTIDIEDDGSGFVMEPICDRAEVRRNKEGGFGVFGISHRAVLIGATVRFLNRKAGGVKVQIDAPIFCPSCAGC